ncbi:DUF488 domain-containing protein [Paenibacillus arenilitoris]|uniref:DUF488 domain-containing protein n=1 Tax=Paenibacillus arenilitoris TaxID=2772299 RepID=A0A927CN44_9BACL|nr:DUF488 domain-containing protein [Paenibacillus arenilitoris]MBD2870609.1 DUF488 domain-containing protein [Paenibacillus arenilitoris]
MDKIRNGIQIKRIYEPAEPEDGLRVLVDRLWPRGMTKERARLTVWMKEVTPSPELRTWFGHEPARLEEFARRYEAELADAAVEPFLDRLRAWAEEQVVTLLYGAKDGHCNHALVLKRYLEKGSGNGFYPFTRTPSRLP